MCACAQRKCDNLSIYKKYGIYQIENIKNHKVYIGKTANNFGDRWDCHKGQLRGGYHDNKELQADWNKYGESSFVFTILHDCAGKSRDEMNELERLEIAKAKSASLAYNLHDGGDESYYKGKHLPDETKAKIGAKNRIHMTGRIASEDTKKRMSESQKKRYANMSAEEKEEAFAYLVELNKGRRRSEEARAKMRNNKNGAKYTLEQVHEIRKLYERDNMSITNIAKATNIPRATVYLIATYRRWAND